MEQLIQINFLSFFVANKDNNDNEYFYLILTKKESENLQKIIKENDIIYFNTYKGLFKCNWIRPEDNFNFVFWELKDARTPKENQNCIDIIENNNILELRLQK